MEIFIFHSASIFNVQFYTEEYLLIVHEINDEVSIDISMKNDMWCQWKLVVGNVFI